MSTSPRFVNYRLTDAELYALISHHFGPVESRDSPGVVAFAIVLAESGGVVNAFRPASQNPGGGDDRGIWQWNSKAHPDITDREAFDPFRATELAKSKSGNGSNWGPWNYGPRAYTGSPRRLDIDAAYRRIQTAKPGAPRTIDVLDKIDAARAATPGVEPAYYNRPGGAGGVVADAVGAATGAAGAVTDAVSGALAWPAALGELLSNLLDVQLWRRIGIGVLGVGLIVAMIAIYNRDNVASLAMTAATKGATK